jgi:hypothetical protein
MNRALAIAAIIALSATVSGCGQVMLAYGIGDLAVTAAQAAKSVVAEDCDAKVRESSAKNTC